MRVGTCAHRWARSRTRSFRGMNDTPSDRTPEPPDPEGAFARRTLLGAMGAAFTGALGVAVLGATHNLPAVTTVAGPSATPQPSADHSQHATASPGASAAPVDHDAQMEAVVKAFPAKTLGSGLQE